MGDQVKSIKDLHGKNIVVYDLETANPINNVTIKWSDHKLMGISVGCLFDYKSGDSHIYLQDNLQALSKRLQEADLIVGFNIMQFDNALISAVTETVQKSDLDRKSYDLLFEIRKSLVGYQRGGCKLNEVLSANFNMTKTEDGSEAPLMFQRGELSRLISYCVSDLRRERMLFELAYIKGHLKTLKHGLHPMNCPMERLPKSA